VCVCWCAVASRLLYHHEQKSVKIQMEDKVKKTPKFPFSFFIFFPQRSALLKLSPSKLKSQPRDWRRSSVVKQLSNMCKTLD
jgi:hypothetical protein